MIAKNETAEQRERRLINQRRACKRWRERHPGAAYASCKGWEKRNPEKAKANRRKTKLKIHFGLTVSQYDAMLASQDGACAICRETETVRRNKHLSVDHCHATGRIRGLLCSKCNTAIGMLRDRPENARAAAEYLSK